MKKKKKTWWIIHTRPWKIWLWSIEEQPQSSSSSGKVCIIADQKKKVCIIYLDTRHQKSAPEENEKF